MDARDIRDRKALALLPVFARDILHTESWGLGFLRAAPGIGALTMALVLTRWHPRRHVGRIIFGAVAVFGLAVLAFALSRSFALSMVALAFMGAADMISVVIRMTIIQLRTPDDMRGRVLAVENLFIGGSNELGAWESGMAGQALGVTWAVVGGGFATLAIVGFWWVAFPDLRNVDRFEDVAVQR